MRVALTISMLWFVCAAAGATEFVQPMTAGGSSLAFVGDDATPAVVAPPADMRVMPVAPRLDEDVTLLVPQRESFLGSMSDAVDEPVIIPVQREEPMMGSTQSEQELRARQQQQMYMGAPGLGNTQLAFGQNTLLFGGFGGVPGLYVSPNKRLVVSLAQTVDYVTNLALPFAITPNSLVQRQNDAQFQTNLYAQYTLYADRYQSLITAANFYQSLHPTVTQLNLWSLTTLTRYTRVLNDHTTFYMDYDYTYFWLFDRSLLTRHRFGPGLLIKTSPCVTWQLNYNYFLNTFRIDPTQNANLNTAQVARYRYLRDPNDYLFAGYLFGNNNADLNAWSYNLHSAYAGARFLYGCCKTRELFVLTSYGNFQFVGFDAPQGAPATIRRDDVWTLTTRLSKRVTQNASVFFQFSYFRDFSNVAVQDFGSSISSWGFIGVW